jgi:hypothetical protein
MYLFPLFRALFMKITDLRERDEVEVTEEFSAPSFAFPGRIMVRIEALKRGRIGRISPEEILLEIGTGAVVLYCPRTGVYNTDTDKIKLVGRREEGAPSS